MVVSVCPWWIGYLLASPLRRLFQKPEEILHEHVREGMVVLDVGCAMGFFSLPLARRVGPKGRVVCVDLQERMIRSLEKRAEKSGLRGRMETRVCSDASLGLEDLAESVDFAVAFAMLHETPSPAETLSQIHAALAPRGRLLIAEPRGHVSAAAFEETVSAAEAHGFSRLGGPQIRGSQSALMEKRRADSEPS